MISGQNIYLRTPEPEDIDILYQWENDPSVWHLSQNPTPFSRFDIEQFVLNTEKDIFRTRQLRLMIIKKTDDIAVGAIDIFDFDPLNHRAGVGILITENERKKGYAMEALGLVKDYCFNKLNMHQLYANIGTDNLDSIKLFKKIGFVGAGLKKEWLLINNKWMDELFYQLINPEF